MVSTPFVPLWANGPLMARASRTGSGLVVRIESDADSALPPNRGGDVSAVRSGAV
jgi:hypothetical protein